MKQAMLLGTAQRGLTLVEVLTTLAVLGVLLGVVAPNLQHLVHAQRLDGAAQTYLSQLHWARMQAVTMNQPVHMRFGSSPSGTCYVIYTGEREGCNCSTPASVCRDGAQALITTEWTSAEGISVTSGTRVSVTVDATRGTITPTFTATLVARDGTSLKAITGVTGRTRVCHTQQSSFHWPACT